MDQNDYAEGLPNENEIIELLPCIICNRSFRPTLLQRHSAICEKNAKKRKIPFDSSKQRRQGTEMAAYLPQVKKTQDIYAGVEKVKKNWKAKHEELIRAVKAARGEKVSDNPIPSKPVDTEACPHCGRNFGPKSYDRHVEFCKERAQRISTAPVISQLAKERLEARTKYRVPPLKSQRAVTKEKYSPKTKSSSRDVSNVPIKPIQPIKTIKKRYPSANRNVSNLPHQPSVLKTKKEQSIKNSFGNMSSMNLPQKVKTNKETVMKKSESAYILGSQNKIQEKIIKTASNYEKKNISKSQYHLDSYDPFKSAEQQMKELELDIIDIGFKKPLNFIPKDNIENLKISPTSAFVKYSPVSSLGSPENIENILPNQSHNDTLASLENMENTLTNQFHKETLTYPENIEKVLPDQIHKNTLDSPENIENVLPDQFQKETNLINHPLHNLSNLSLCSIVSIESADFNNKIHSAVIRSIEFSKSPTKRCISHNPKKQIAIENMLYGDNEKDLKPDLKFDLAEQELLKSVSEFENLLKLTDDDDIVSPSLNRTSALSMINGVNSNSSADSAYGSLNRKSEQMTNENYLTLLKTAKFCHECGYKYPIADVKFCTECGMRRIVL